MASNKELALPLSMARTLFDYNPVTGDITRKVTTSSRAISGGVVGSCKAGYLVTSISGKQYRNHRLAWFIFYGEWPKEHIDHIDGETKNNAINNLRDVSRFCNMQNIKGPSNNNRLGVLGVTRVNNRYRVKIMSKRVVKHIGYYATEKEASEAYVKAKRELHSGNTL